MNEQKSSKGLNNDLQNIHKTIDRVTQTPQRVNSSAPEEFAVPVLLETPVVTRTSQCLLVVVFFN